MTPAVFVGLIPAAATRSACIRCGVAAYAWPGPGGAAGMVARNNAAPGTVGAAAGEPGAVPTAPKLWNTGASKTAATVWMSEFSCCGLLSWGAVPSLHAAAATAAAAARPHQVRRAFILLLRLWKRVVATLTRNVPTGAPGYCDGAHAARG